MEPFAGDFAGIGAVTTTKNRAIYFHPGFSIPMICELVYILQLELMTPVRHLEEEFAPRYRTEVLERLKSIEASPISKCSPVFCALLRHHMPLAWVRIATLMLRHLPKCGFSPVKILGGTRHWWQRPAIPFAEGVTET